MSCLIFAYNEESWHILPSSKAVKPWCLPYHKRRPITLSYRIIRDFLPVMSCIKKCWWQWCVFVFVCVCACVNCRQRFPLVEAKDPGPAFGTYSYLSSVPSLHLSEQHTGVIVPVAGGMSQFWLWNRTWICRKTALGTCGTITKFLSAKGYVVTCSTHLGYQASDLWLKYFILCSFCDDFHAHCLIPGSVDVF